MKMECNIICILLLRSNNVHYKLICIIVFVQLEYIALDKFYLSHLKLQFLIYPY